MTKYLLTLPPKKELAKMHVANICNLDPVSIELGSKIGMVRIDRQLALS